MSEEKAIIRIKTFSFIKVMPMLLKNQNGSQQALKALPKALDKAGIASAMLTFLNLMKPLQL
jgi:hypothetical protein